MRRAVLPILGLALAAASLLSAGAVVVAPDPAGDGLPGNFAVPAPRVGDRAHYEVRQVAVDRGWLLTPFFVLGVDAEWRPAAEARDAHGVLRTVAPLALRADYEWHDGSYRSSVHQLAAYDPAGWRQVSVTNDEEFPERREVGGLDGPVVHVGGTTEEARAWFETRMLQAFRGPCGFAGGLVAGARPGEDVRLGGRCGRQTLNTGDGDLFRMAAVEDAGGIPAVRFDNPDHPEVQVWANPGIPFPVKVRDNFVDLFEPGKTGCCVFEWTLTAYEPGAEAYVHAPPQGDPRAFPLADAPLGLPDEAGEPHDFPISAAVARLLADDPAAAAFLRDSPAAYVGESTAWRETDEAGRASWHHRLVLTDGRHHVSRHVYTEPTPYVAQAPRPPGLPAGLPVSVPVHIEPWNNRLPDDVTGIYPTPEQRPAQLPRVHDVAEAFKAGANESVRAKPLGWGVLHACYGDCERPFSFVRVNVLDSPVTAGPLAPPGALQPGIANAALAVRADGTVLAEAKRTQSLQAESLLPLGPAPLEASSQRVAAPAAGLPYAPVAAVAGGLALAALAAWLWSAKAGAGALGLFSRIEAPRLLDHPGRAAIIQAIEAEPGIHLRGLARRTGQAEGSLRHHLRKLEAAGLAVSRPLNGYLCWFVPADARSEGAAAKAAARSDGARKILAAVHGGTVGVRAIAAATGLAPSTVVHHLAKLREAGALPAEPETGSAAA